MEVQKREPVQQFLGKKTRMRVFIYGDGRVSFSQKCNETPKDWGMLLLNPS